MGVCWPSRTHRRLTSGTLIYLPLRADGFHRGGHNSPAVAPARPPLPATHFKCLRVLRVFWGGARLGCPGSKTVQTGVEKVCLVAQAPCCPGDVSSPCGRPAGLHRDGSPRASRRGKMPPTGDAHCPHPETHRSPSRPRTGSLGAPRRLCPTESLRKPSQSLQPALPFAPPGHCLWPVRWPAACRECSGLRRSQPSIRA